MLAKTLWFTITCFRVVAALKLPIIIYKYNINYNSHLLLRLKKCLAETSKLYQLFYNLFNELIGQRGINYTILAQIAAVLIFIISNNFNQYSIFI